MNSNNEYKGICKILDAAAVAEAYIAGEVHTIRIKGKELFPAKWGDPFFAHCAKSLENIPTTEFYFPCALGILGQPLADVYSGERFATREPVYKSTVPKLGEQDSKEPL